MRCEGSGAPTGAGGLAQPPWRVSRRAGIACEAFPRPWRRTLASRRSTAVLTTASTVAQLRTALGGALRPRLQAPCGRLVVAGGRSPEQPECEVTSLARGGRPRLRQPNVSGRRPSVSRDN